MNESDQRGRVVKWLCIFITVTGCIRMVGEAFSVRALNGAGALLGYAPYPKVFCSVDGYEAFSSRFFIVGKLADGSDFRQEIDAATYGKLRGPYNRRNVYGAATVFAPRLPEDLREVLHASFFVGENAPAKDWGLPTDLREASLEIINRQQTEKWVYPLSIKP